MSNLTIISGMNMPSKYKDEFIARLKSLRESKFKNQAEFARLLKLDPGTYNKYENRTILPAHLLAPAARLLDVSLNYLITGDNAPLLLVSENKPIGATIDKELLIEVLETVIPRTKDDEFTINDKAEIIANMYQAMADEPKESRSNSLFGRMLGRLADVLVSEKR